MNKVIWFMGLSGSGKTTLATMLRDSFQKEERPTILIDADVFRLAKHPKLGFTIDEREFNLKRAAILANQLVCKNRYVIAAFITPLRKFRGMIREIIGIKNIVFVYTKCPLEICERRDPKGLYKDAREGKIENFTGIDSIFQESHSHEIEIDTSSKTPKESFEELKEKLNCLESYSPLM